MTEFLQAFLQSDLHLISSRLPFDLQLSFPDVCTSPDFYIIFMLSFRTALFYRGINLHFTLSVFTYGQTAIVATNTILFCSVGLAGQK